MSKKHHAGGTALMTAILMLSGCTSGLLGHGGEKLRPTNVGIQILSQSSFQGEVLPCG